MFAIIKTENGYAAKESPHYSKIQDAIDQQLANGIPVILVMDVAQVQGLGIDPASVTMEGAAPEA